MFLNDPVLDSGCSWLAWDNVVCLLKQDRPVYERIFRNRFINKRWQEVIQVFLKKFRSKPHTIFKHTWKGPWKQAAMKSFYIACEDEMCDDENSTLSFGFKQRLVRHIIWPQIYNMQESLSAKKRDDICVASDGRFTEHTPWATIDRKEVVLLSILTSCPSDCMTSLKTKKKITKTRTFF